MKPYHSYLLVIGIILLGFSNGESFATITYSPTEPIALTGTVQSEQSIGQVRFDITPPDVAGSMQ